MNLVPPLPLLTDVATIFKIYDNTCSVKKDRKTTKSDKSGWHNLETLGDSVILLLLREFITTRFGLEINLGFLKVLEDHAKSNECLQQLAKDYNLSPWVKKIAPQKLGNLFEVWIGSVYLERRLWDGQPYERLDEFFSRLWDIRYRALLPYMQQRSDSYWTVLSVGEMEGIEVISNKIYYPDSPLFDQCHLSHLAMQRRPIGFVARRICTQLYPEQQNSVEVFDPDQGKARDLARLVVRSSPLQGTKRVT